jgi:hypothetical protein
MTKDKTEHINVRVRPAIKAMLAELAEAESRSQAEQVEWLIRQAHRRMKAAQSMRTTESAL